MTDILWHTGIGDFTFTDRDLRRRFPNDRRHVLNRRAETDYMQRGIPEEDRHSGFIWFGQQVAVVLGVDFGKLVISDHLDLILELTSVGLIGWSNQKTEDTNMKGYVLYPAKRDSSLKESPLYAL